MSRKMTPEEKHVTELVRRRMKESKSSELLGFDVESVHDGRAIFRLDVRPHHKQIHGVVHGGILAALPDTTDAIAIVPLDCSAQLFPRLQYHHHRGASLHLLDPIEVLRVRYFWRRGLLAGNGPVVVIVRGAGRRLFLDVRKVGTVHAAVHHDYSLTRLASFLPCDAHCGRWVSFIMTRQKE